MRKIFIELFLLLILSSLIIFFQFNEIPKKLSWDEVEFSRLALSLENKPYLPYSRLATGHSTLYFYAILASFQIFGVTNFALRFPAALFGIMNVLIFYTITKRVFSQVNYFKKAFFFKKIPIIGESVSSFIPFSLSLIFISSRWYFNFARFSFEATFLLFLELMAILFLIVWFKKQRLLYLIFVSFFSGLAFLSYTPGRIFFLVPLVFIILYSYRNLLLKNVFVFFLLFLVTASPLVFYLSTNKDTRIEEQLFLVDKKLNVQNKIDYFVVNSIKISGMFNLYGDLNGRHNYPGKPILNPIIGAFFLLGILVAFLNVRKSFNQLFLLYFIVSITPALFTYPAENPNSLRTFTAIIPTVFFVGNGVAYLLQLEAKSKILFIGLTSFLITFFALAMVYDLRTYFLYQKEVFKKAFELNGSIMRIMNLKLWEKNQSL
ncbi:hypothetical protein A2866_04990 [Candidatus Roizmanbacteria bacterium RIFCSPHIGHO2_01_FULL_39_8]|uniref:Glycosyltransferase RgtA/B/C/D-like domain-containing protein n=1 Tax=Candidatus Roizmanbacteria bacterium RIFCSPHIGHO2_01_FULL_39_8 TaxID=1802033 RepID=A0A1F7GPX4_9BACT|nr:MAG: hypothetical protein A2866_04990 [Candidatus Roizmanbacteria bacterium RIFCSPHIGHO2_01_FULL_39_8]